MARVAQGATAALLLGIAMSQASAGAAPDTAKAMLRAAGGIMIAYPRSWRAAAIRDGTVIGLTAPRTTGPRPAVTILLAQRPTADAGFRLPYEMRELLESASQGVARGAVARLLGERHFSDSRWARYYLRAADNVEEYVVLGVAEGGGWTATMVAVDARSDPDLRERALVFQQILIDVVLPR